MGRRAASLTPFIPLGRAPSLHDAEPPFEQWVAQRFAMIAAADHVHVPLAVFAELHAVVDVEFNQGDIARDLYSALRTQRADTSVLLRVPNVLGDDHGYDCRHDWLRFISRRSYSAETDFLQVVRDLRGWWSRICNEVHVLNEAGELHRSFHAADRMVSEMESNIISFKP